MLFIFDMDNVLYDYHWRIRMESLTELTGHDFHDLRARWWHDEGEWKAEAGDPDTGDEYLRLVNEAFGSNIPRQTWVDIRKAAMEFRPEVAEAVSLASQHGQVTLLNQQRHVDWGTPPGGSPRFGATLRRPHVCDRSLPSTKTRSDSVLSSTGALWPERRGPLLC